MIKKHLSIIVLTALVTLSCSKKEGCTDTIATNFSTDAEKDDGSCTYATITTNTVTTTATDSTTTGGGTNTVADIDGNTYKTVIIGDQEWMAENLNVTKYSNGDLIPNVTDNGAWSALTTGSYCWYGNDSTAYDAKYGKLYNWYAASDSRNLCPTGWHVPNESDWGDLITNTNAENGLPLMATSGWSTAVGYEDKFRNGTDDYGFAAVPGGVKGADFSDEGFWGWFWTQSSTGPTSGSMIVQIGGLEAELNSDPKDYGASMRCIKN